MYRATDRLQSAIARVTYTEVNLIKVVDVPNNLATRKICKVNSLLNVTLPVRKKNDYNSKPTYNLVYMRVCLSLGGLLL